MIVVDATVVAYLLLPHPEHTEQADRLLARDAAWCAPALWRSELRNVLAAHVRERGLPLEQSVELLAAADELLGARTGDVVPEVVLRLAAASGCSAYDCEYVALAHELDVPLVTTNAAVLDAFPDLAVSPREFLSRS